MKTEQQIRAEAEVSREMMTQYCFPPGGPVRQLLYESLPFSYGWLLALEWVLSEPTKQPPVGETKQPWLPGGPGGGRQIKMVRYKRLNLPDVRELSEPPYK